MSQCFINIGGWTQYLAEIWLIYSFAHSALMLGVLGVLQSAPILVFSVFTGVLIDKIPRRKIIIITTLFNIFMSLVLALFIWVNILKEWHLLLVASFWGLSSAMEFPAKQAFINDVVNREDISNAIALYSSIDNIGRMIGPALAGLIVSTLGIKFCFLFHAALNLPMLIMLLKYKMISDFNIEKHNILTDIKGGLKYVVKTSILNKSILSATFVGIFEFNFSLLIPLFAYNVFKLDDAGVSVFMTVLGAGCIAGSVFTIIKSNSKKTINKLFILVSAISLFYLLIGINTNYHLSLLLFAISGAFCVVFFTNVNSIIIINAEKQ